MNIPLRFEPFLRPMVWGGRRLGELLGKQLPTNEPYGESWEISDHPMHRSVIAAGRFAGRTLRQLMEQDRRSLLGGSAGRHEIFPWLIKFLDAWDWLSVQVHPDEDAVRRLLPGEGSKTEAWYVMQTAPGSRIYAGLLPEIDRKKLLDALHAGTVTECLHSFEPQPGDCLFFPAGTVHAVGGGVLMAEVQQTSDATFRLFDWNRQDAHGNMRKLHIEESLESIHWDQGPVEPIRTGASAAQLLKLVDCRYFELELVRARTTTALGGTNRLGAAIVLDGAGSLETTEGEIQIQKGETWLLPATMPKAMLQPDSGVDVLVSWLPL
jgi:mannose-6-phosphate isomerase